MRLKRVGLLLALALFGAAGVANAQSTTGTIRGHVADAQGLALPGVTISVTSPNLQGTRVAVSSENGDYVLNLLPSGTYTIAYELSGFQRQQRTVSLAPTQDLPVDIALGPAAISEEVSVVGRAADVLTNTAQVATNFKQQLIADLPTTRNIDAYLLLAPAVHPTGPNGYYSIAGSVSFENLFLVNGVTVNENLRGQAFDLYIEDAIQETTIATGGVSAEYGRFSGGVVNVVTKSGGNQYQGSFRETLVNDQWRALTPYETTAIAGGATDTRKQCDISDVNCVVPTHEYTFGGPIMRDRLWFFTAGRLQKRTEGRQLVATNIPYTNERPTQRFEGKGTFSFSPTHRLQGAYTRINDKEVNNTFSTSTSMDLNSLLTRRTPEDLYVVNYSGAVRSNLFVEALYSNRHFTFIGAGAPTTDLINGTLMVDNQRGLRFWSPTFCGVCDNETRDNSDLYGKATYFLSTSKSGSHNMTFGGDSFNDIHFANNHQSGSDYRIFTTSTIVRGNGPGAAVYPQILGNGTTIIQWNPIPLDSEGSNFRTYSAFYNDAWRVNAHLTANLGVRWDKNHGVDQQGNLVANDSAISPRLGVVVDPAGDGKWSVTGSFAQYTAALSNSIGDSSSAGGNPQTYRFVYRGPDINANTAAATLTQTQDAIAQVFNWYNANGGASLPLERNPTIPGVTPQIRGNLKSPNVLEYATGVNRQIGNRAAARVDYVFRDYKDIYIERRDTSTGKVTNSANQTFDLGLIENTSDLKRRYSGVSTQGTYRAGARTDIGATYTLSHVWGNFNGENVSSGPTTADAFVYPEYKQESWNYPIGDLQIDQRHRARLWINYGVPRVSGLTVSVLETLESGVPFGANNLNNANANGVNPQPYVTNPGYVGPPTGSNTSYFFTADCGRLPSTIPSQIDCVGGQRDGFRTEGQKRTDFAASYTHNVKAGGHPLELFVQAQVVNLFNQSQLCGCGDTVFVNGGSVTQTRIDQTVRTNVSNPATYAPFNPFTTTPVQGVNWDYAPTFGTALNRFAYTTPRQFRIGFGVRF
ncbi:MAG TPA: TonB-dependent receptor [Vicinamibacterales bacterium]|jgi:outer membrane receptor for ferrienterochelin and colicin